MDNIFGIGAPELILILLIAGIVMGPERIGRAARWLGKTTAQLQAISRSFMRQLNAELDGVDQSGDLRGAMDEVQELRRQIAELRSELLNSTDSSIRETRAILDDTRREVEQSIAPPNLAKSANGSRSTAEKTDEPPLRLQLRSPNGSTCPMTQIHE